MDLNKSLARLAIPTGHFKIWYDFNQSGAAYISSIASGQAKYSGQVLPTIGEFYKNEESGYFNSGRYISIKNNSDITGSKTFLFHFEKSGNNSSVLFSSLQTGLSGYLFGINSAYKPYMAFYKNSIPQVLTCDFTALPKSFLAVSVTSRAVNFSQYNLATDKMQGQGFSFDNSQVLESNLWYLGAPINCPSQFSGSSFTGYFDDFAVFSQNLNPIALSLMISGGITGRNVYGNDTIQITKPIASGDFVEIYSFTQTGIFNQSATYDYGSGQFKLATTSNNSGINLFINGSGQYPSGDYSVDGRYIRNSGAYPSGVTGLYDNITGIRSRTLNFCHTTGSGNQFFPIVPGDLVFFNGIKLISGSFADTSGSAHIYPSGTSVVFPAGKALYSGISGSLFVLPGVNTYTRTTGNITLVSGLSKFIPTCSQVWINGLRQRISGDYRELSSLSFMGTGVGYASSLIYDNNGLFWEGN